jgi:hypothetical protein
MDPYQRTLWVEICAQVLTALFTITGIGLFPSRLRDTYWILIVAHYGRVTRIRRAAQGLGKLKDRNDLPDPEAPSLSTELRQIREGRITPDVASLASSVDEEAVLTDVELSKLRDAQVSFLLVIARCQVRQILIRSIMMCRRNSESVKLGIDLIKHQPIALSQLCTLY